MITSGQILRTVGKVMHHVTRKSSSCVNVIHKRLCIICFSRNEYRTIQRGFLPKHPHHPSATSGQAAMPIILSEANPFVPSKRTIIYKPKMPNPKEKHACPRVAVKHILRILTQLRASELLKRQRLSRMSDLSTAQPAQVPANSLLSSLLLLTLLFVESTLSILALSLLLELVPVFTLFIIGSLLLRSVSRGIVIKVRVFL